MTEISIRAETPADYDDIRALIVDVFHETYGSGEAEAALVEQLRQQPDWGPNISLVAERHGVLVGHLFFSAVRLENHSDIPVCALAPLGVYRQYQQQGIGSQLAYYLRFGFIPITDTRLQTIFHADHDMVLALEDGTLDSLSGLVVYPEPWDVFI